MKKILTIAGMVLLLAVSVFAEDSAENEGVKLSFSTTTDFAYCPSTDFVAGATHFAPVTGAYGGVEGRITADFGVLIPTPLGENWLVSGANLSINPKFELTPVSIKPMLDITWTPLPFLVFTTGVQAGTGWNLLGMQGMAAWNESTATYDDKTPFGTWLLKWYAQGTFQFDLGVVIPGDWTHIQMMYSYQVYYHALTGVADGQPWMWQCGGKYGKGFQNYQNLILAYGLPNPVITRVGFMFELDGFYSSNVFNKELYPNYNDSFKTISIAPLAQFQFGSNDTLTFLVGFSSRRSFVEAHTDENIEINLTYSGYEWYFKRVAFSWTHKFF